MPRCRFTGVNHYHDGELLQEGDVVELSEAEYDAFGYQFARLDEPEASNEDVQDSAGDEPEADDDGSNSEGEESPEDEQTESELHDLLDQSVPDLRNILETGEYDEQLDRLEEIESEGDDRTTAHEAIQERREATEG